jgi:GntR family transcriptional regulator
VRDLAARLRVNPNTVARVYRELQVEGLLASRQGSGTFVGDAARQMGLAEGREILRQRLAEATTLGRNLGLSAAELREVLDEAWDGSAGALVGHPCLPRPGRAGMPDPREEKR